MNYKKIKSYEDACKALGLKPISDEVFNVFGEDAKTMAAYHKLAVITRAINEGWQPDWKDRGQEKYEPYMYTNSAGLAYAYTYHAPSYTRTNIVSRLCFPDYDRAAFAVSTFGDLYKDYFRPKDYGTQEQKAADDSKQNAESENGGDDEEEVIEDDMSDAPDFLKKVVEATKQHIEPLCKENRKKGGIILIGVEKYENDEGEELFATTVASQGAPSLLAKGLNKFMTCESAHDIVEHAVWEAKFQDLLNDAKELLEEIKNTH